MHTDELTLQVLLLENTRFYKGECDNDLSFAQQVGPPV